MFFFFFFFIDFRERGRERNIDLSFHLFMCTLRSSCMCPNQGLNPQFWHIKTTLLSTELPSQGQNNVFIGRICGLAYFLALVTLTASYLVLSNSNSLSLCLIAFSRPDLNRNSWWGRRSLVETSTFTELSDPEIQ